MMFIPISRIVIRLVYLVLLFLFKSWARHTKSANRNLEPDHTHSSFPSSFKIVVIIGLINYMCLAHNDNLVIQIHSYCSRLKMED